jgi:hypothetical protein
LWQTGIRIRLNGHRFLLDGQESNFLIVPVMTLEEAISWRGEGCVAGCLTGIPRRSPVDVANSGSLYREIGLTNEALVSVDHTRGVENDQINLAYKLLETVVPALHDMIAGLSYDELQ